MWLHLIYPTISGHFPHLRILFFFFLIEELLLYNIVLVSAVQHSGSAMYRHISHPSWTPPPLPSHPSRSPQSTELSSLCGTAASHQLSIWHMVVCICHCYSKFVPLPLPVPSPVSTRLFCTSASLVLPCKYVNPYRFSAKCLLLYKTKYSRDLGFRMQLSIGGYYSLSYTLEK